MILWLIMQMFLINDSVRYGWSVITQIGAIFPKTAQRRPPIASRTGPMSLGNREQRSRKLA